MTKPEITVAELLELLVATLKAGDMPAAVVVITAIAGRDPETAEAILRLLGTVQLIKQIEESL